MHFSPSILLKLKNIRNGNHCVFCTHILTKKIKVIRKNISHAKRVYFSPYKRVFELKIAGLYISFSTLLSTKKYSILLKKKGAFKSGNIQRIARISSSIKVCNTPLQGGRNISSRNESLVSRESDLLYTLRCLFYFHFCETGFFLF